MNQAYLRRIGFGIALLTFSQLPGCSTSGSKTTPPGIVPQITQFSASPTDVNSGQTSTITWAATNAASVAISPAVPQSDDTGPLPTSGSSIAPIIATTTNTLTATVPFTLSLSVSPATITAGQTANLSWQITGGTATALSIDNGVCSPSATPCAMPGTATVKPNV